MASSTPMLDQYRRIKNEHTEEILFFRLGDFYEMFAEDAVEVSSLINLTLTSRNGLPMCGVPYHASHTYIARLLKLGKKIAICEQISLPGPGKGLAERKVIEVITPGTTVDEDYLDTGSSNYLAAVIRDRGSISFACIEPSTGDFRATSFPLEAARERLQRELESLEIRELIVPESLLGEVPAVAEVIAARPGYVVNRWADWLFDRRESTGRLEKQFGTANLKAFGLDDLSPEIISAGTLLGYLDTTSRANLPHVRHLCIYGESDFVGLDESTQRNLELVRSLREGDHRFTLLEVMDETRSAMGLRLLKKRILRPLRSLEAIERRLDAVESLYRSQSKLTSLREALSRSQDLERLCSRLAMDRSNARDLVAIRVSIAAFFRVQGIAREAEISESLDILDPSQVAHVSERGCERLEQLRLLLERSLLDEPSLLLSEGKIIRPEWHPELSRLHSLKDEGHALLESYLEEEKAASGIQSLKIRYNRIIGYFIEVTKSNLSQIPPHFIRRQSVSGAERYTTVRLSELESEINGASDKVIELEKKLFLEIREEAKTCLAILLEAAHRIAALDVAQSLAQAATIRSWVRPRLDGERRLEMVEARHPVVEAHLESGNFVPNDIQLDGEGTSFALITGPNMAGKSTYLRQTALVTIMAQMGSFVPALSARIGLVDKVFCRVGASDNLARGESTFLVEMNETAHILRTATDRSLVIMDEVGRGTGTNDGLAIAWAVCEELLANLGARSLFATHYHELSRLEHPKLARFCMDVLEKEGEIVFLKKIKSGSAAESYGLHVARLAGIPDQVIDRAEEILGQLKKVESSIPPETGKISRPRDPKLAVSPVEMELANIDPDMLTPMAALAFIQNWKRLQTAKPRVSKKPESSMTLSLFDS